MAHALYFYSVQEKKMKAAKQSSEGLTLHVTPETWLMLTSSLNSQNGKWISKGK